MGLTGIKVGDELMLVDSYNRGGGPRKVTVTKVGRKLVTVQSNGQEEVFRIDTGYKNDGYHHSFLETPEHYEERQRRGNLMGVLRNLGIEFDFKIRKSELSIDRIQALIAVMEDDSL